MSKTSMPLAFSFGLRVSAKSFSELLKSLFFRWIISCTWPTPTLLSRSLAMCERMTSCFVRSLNCGILIKSVPFREASFNALFVSRCYHLDFTERSARAGAGTRRDV